MFFVSGQTTNFASIQLEASGILIPNDCALHRQHGKCFLLDCSDDKGDFSPCRHWDRPEPYPGVLLRCMVNFLHTFCSPIKNFESDDFDSYCYKTWPFLHPVVDSNDDQFDCASNGYREYNSKLLQQIEHEFALHQLYQYEQKW